MPNGAAWSAGEIRFPYRCPRYSPDTRVAISALGLVTSPLDFLLKMPG
jgi:hypothetical protein